MCAMRRKHESPFRKILCQLMEKQHLSVRRAAQIAGVAPSTVSNWRAGAAPEDYLALRRLADYLGVTLGYLLTGQADAPQANKDQDSQHTVLFEGYARILIHAPVGTETSTAITLAISSPRDPEQ